MRFSSAALHSSLPGRRIQDCGQAVGVQVVLVQQLRKEVVEAGLRVAVLAGVVSGDSISPNNFSVPDTTFLFRYRLRHLGGPYKYCHGALGSLGYSAQCQLCLAVSRKLGPFSRCPYHFNRVIPTAYKEYVTNTYFGLFGSFRICGPH